MLRQFLSLSLFLLLLFLQLRFRFAFNINLFLSINIHFELHLHFKVYLVFYEKKRLMCEHVIEAQTGLAQSFGSV